MLERASLDYLVGNLPLKSPRKLAWKRGLFESLHWLCVRDRVKLVRMTIPNNKLQLKWSGGMFMIFKVKGREEGGDNAEERGEGVSERQIFIATQTARPHCAKKLPFFGSVLEIQVNIF